MTAPGRGPLAQPCPHCQSAVGERCRAPSGVRANTHVTRWVSRHGASQPEAERTTERLALRVRPGTRAALDALAAREGTTRSQVVERLVMGAR